MILSLYNPDRLYNPNGSKINKNKKQNIAIPNEYRNLNLFISSKSYGLFKYSGILIVYYDYFSFNIKFDGIWLGISKNPN